MVCELALTLTSPHTVRLDLQIAHVKCCSILERIFGWLFWRSLSIISVVAISVELAPLVLHDPERQRELCEELCVHCGADDKGIILTLPR